MINNILDKQNLKNCMLMTGYNLSPNKLNIK